MKKPLYLSFLAIFILILSLSLVGCGGDSSNSATKKLDSTTSFNPGKDIGVTTAPYGASANNDALTIETSDRQKYTFHWKVDNDKNKYLTLVNNTGATVMTFQDPYAKNQGQYQITEYQLKDPNFKIWTLVDNEGSGQYNLGYWVIGEYHGKIIKYLDRSNLKTMIANGNLRDYLKVEALPDGLQLFMSNTPFANDKDSKEEDASDLVPVKLFWDTKADWFGMRYGNSDEN